MLNKKSIALFSLGAFVTLLFFIWSNATDAPGLCLLGMMFGFLLVLRGIYCAKLLKKGLHIPIMLAFFGIIAIGLPLVLLWDNEIQGYSKGAFFAQLAGAVCIAIAIAQIVKVKRGGK